MRTKESNKKAVAKWRKKNKKLSNERAKTYNKKWAKANKEKKAASSKRWDQENLEKTREHCRRRRISKSKADGSHTVQEWESLKETFFYTCPACGRSNIELTRDHIIPLSKKGSDYIKNIQPLCRSCNSKKSINIIEYEPVNARRSHLIN